MIVHTAALLTGDLFPGDGPVRIRVRPPTGSLTIKIEFELSDLSDRISLKEVSPTEIVLQAAPAKVNLALKGSLIAKTSAGSPPSAGTRLPPAKRRRPLGALPAIPCAIVPLPRHGARVKWRPRQQGQAT
jgi:hypothetical protein